MYQRQQRQNLGGTNVNSPFFTSHAEQQPSSSPPVASSYGNGYGGSYYASSSSQQAPSYYGNTGTSPMNSSGMGSTTIPTSTASYDAKVKGRSRSGSGGGISYLFFFIWTLMLFMAAYGYVKYVALPKQRLQDIQVEEEDVEELQHEWKTKYHDLKIANTKLQETYQTLEQTSRDTRRKLEQAEGAELELNEVHLELSKNQQWALEWKEKASSLDTLNHNLQRSIQEVSRRQVLQKFGPGPFRVEFHVQFGEEGESQWMTMELVPLEEMPHTIWFFLNQVDQGLYNHGDYGFRFNAPHVTQAAPLTDEALERFIGSGLGEVLVSEYSQNMPHQLYTVGLSGRPGGPDFYVNTQDNTQIHGPGGYAKDGSADVCFGKITRGWELVDRIHAMTGELQAGDWKEMHPTHTPTAAIIRSITILH